MNGIRLSEPGLLTVTLAGLGALALLACDAPGSSGPVVTPAADVPGDLLVVADPGPPPADVAATPDIGPKSDLPKLDIPKADVPIGLPDISLGKKDLGGVCVDGDDCVDGWCNAAYPGGYCSSQCTSDADCPELSKCFADIATSAKMCWKQCQSAWDCRSDQFCAPGANICTPKCQTGGCNTGYQCDLDSGKCIPIGSVSCEPLEEVCDGVDNDCDDLVDEGCGPGVLAWEPTSIVDDMGLVEVGGGGLSNLLSFNLSSAASSFEIVILSADGSDEYTMVWDLTSPSGEGLINASDPYDSVVRWLPGMGNATLLVPNAPSVPIESGKYKFTVFKNGDPGQCWVYVIQNIRPLPTQSRLDLNFWFVGLPGLTASSANNVYEYIALRDYFEGLLGQHGVAVGQLKLFDVTGVDADKYAIIDVSGSGVGIDEHAELLSLSGTLPSTNKGVNFFFVQGFTGWSLLGRAGSIPGPPVHGTYYSGVAVSLADLYNDPDTDGAIKLTGHAMVHELYHQLGLYHTSERDGAQHDPIGDTPQCSNDNDGDGQVDLGECISKGSDNVMFWSAHYANTLTNGQLFVLHRNPSLTDP
jgi:hypothetical protein